MLVNLKQVDSVEKTKVFVGKNNESTIIDGIMKIYSKIPSDVKIIDKESEIVDGKGSEKV